MSCQRLLVSGDGTANRLRHPKPCAGSRERGQCAGALVRVPCAIRPAFRGDVEDDPQCPASRVLRLRFTAGDHWIQWPTDYHLHGHRPASTDNNQPRQNGSERLSAVAGAVAGARWLVASRSSSCRIDGVRVGRYILWPTRRLGDSVVSARQARFGSSQRAVAVCLWCDQEFSPRNSGGSPDASAALSIPGTKWPEG
jgi:hypothetical protein